MLVLPHSFLSEEIDFHVCISFESLFYQPSLFLGRAEVSSQNYPFIILHFFVIQRSSAKFSCTIPQCSTFHTLKWGNSLPSFFPLRDSISEYVLKICASTLHCSTIPSFGISKFPLSAFSAASLSFLATDCPMLLRHPSLLFTVNFEEGRLPTLIHCSLEGIDLHESCQKSLLHWATIPHFYENATVPPLMPR